MKFNAEYSAKRLLPKQKWAGAFLQLQKWSEKAQDILCYPQDSVVARLIQLRYFMGNRKSLLEILGNTLYDIKAIEERTIFKVVIKTAVVKVYRANSSRFTITNDLFGMKKAGSILVYPNAAANQTGIVATSNLVNQLFIGDAGGDDPYIHAAFSCQRQGSGHFVADNEVGCHNIKRVLCAIDKIDVNILA